MFHVCRLYVVLSVPCSLMVTCLERADLLALLYVVFLCFCHFSIWRPGSVFVLEVSIPELCLDRLLNEMQQYAT